MRRLTLQDRVRLGNAVSRIRARQRCTQAELGKALGVPQPIVSEWERGIRIPSHAALVGLAQLGAPRDAGVLSRIRSMSQSRGNGSDQVASSSHSISIAPVTEASNV